MRKSSSILERAPDPPLISNQSGWVDLKSQGTENTAFLLQLVREGDERAEEQLFCRFLPKLKHWARGRLPMDARSLTETDDLVQTTLMQAFKRIKSFEHRGEGAFLAYLRQILVNEMRSVLRKRQPLTVDDAPELVDQRPSPSQRFMSLEAYERYEKGLSCLSAPAREAIILRLEFDYTYSEIAEALEKPSADAARMFVTRAIQQLAHSMSP